MACSLFGLTFSSVSKNCTHPGDDRKIDSMTSYQSIKYIQELNEKKQGINLLRAVAV